MPGPEVRTIDPDRNISGSLPEPVTSSFLLSDPFHIEMLVRVSKHLSQRDVTFNQAVSLMSKISSNFYGRVVRSGRVFSQLSASVQRYINENPGLVTYVHDCHMYKFIDYKGNVRAQTVLKPFVPQEHDFSS